MKRTADHYLAIDLGASSGRVMLGTLHNGRLALDEIHRFVNQPVSMDGTLVWNIVGLWAQVLEGLRACAGRGIVSLSGIGVDTWGVDFGLLGRDGGLLGMPVHYRDARTEGIERKIARRIPAETVYRITGLALARVSTLAQLVAMSQSRAHSTLLCAETLLMMPDLFRFLLCGSKACELTIAGSSQLLDIQTGQWASRLFREFRLPRSMMLPPVKPGTIAGRLRADVSEQTGLRDAPVIAVAGHDTASAAAAVPMTGEDTIFISSGTWSVLGIRRRRPITTPEACRRGFVNEFGFRSVLFVKNMMGLYLAENLRRAWARQGYEPTYTEMVRAASKAKPFNFFIDIGSPLFFAAEENVEKSGHDYLRMTGQKGSPGRSEWIRSLFEAQAFSYRDAVRSLEQVTQRAFRRICVIGGGSRNALLCQFTADATGLEVVAGPAEATVIGNIAIQALATGRLGSADEIPALINRSFRTVTYRPRQTERWSKQYEHYKDVLQKAQNHREKR